MSELIASTVLTSELHLKAAVGQEELHRALATCAQMLQANPSHRTNGWQAGYAVTNCLQCGNAQEFRYAPQDDGPYLITIGGRAGCQHVGERYHSRLYLYCQAAYCPGKGSRRTHRLQAKALVADVAEALAAASWTLASLSLIG